MARECTYFDVREIKRETDKAFLLELESGEEFWVPKSVVADANDYNEGDENVSDFAIQEWWCEANDKSNE